MKQKEEKKVFFARLKQEIKNRETLKAFYNTTFQEVLNQFDGKVYNKRFETALNQALKEVSPLMYASFSLKSPNSYSNFPKQNYIEVVITHYYESGNYNNKEEFYTNIVLRYDASYNRRISATDSKVEKYTCVWAENFDKETEEEKNILKEYTKYLKVAEQMTNAVKAFNSLPYRFRANIDKEHLTIY